jgi:D-threo-aldose 1-dehydrogenase
MSSATQIRRFVTRGGRPLDFTLLGFGSAPLGNYLQPLDESACDSTVEAAWDCGIRYFDTAPFYGLSLAESRVGRVLRALPRDRFVISTKVGRALVPCAEGEQKPELFVNTPPYRVEFDYSYDGVMRSFEESLRRLGLERVDILFVHDIDALVHGDRERSERRLRELFDHGGWRALDGLRSNGVVSAIGAGVNEWEPCVRLLELADPDLFLLAGRYTLLEQPPADAFFPKCAERGARVVIGGPYNSGVLAGKGTYNYSSVPPAIAQRVAALERECAACGVSLRAAALQFIAAHPLVVSVIPGAISAREVADNVAALDEPIPPSLWQRLKDCGLLDTGVRTP